jgi:transcriptional regulator with XRE-family HTH domain
MDPLRLAAVFRAVRIRKRWRQQDVARAAGVSRATIARAENASLVELPLRTILRIAVALDIRIDLLGRWRGGELDRMLNAGHAAMHEAVAETLARLPGWAFRPEVSFAVFGERGVIDILAFHAATGSLLVIELKTQLVDVQGLIGSVDRYVRLAPTIARDLGWTVRHVCAWVLLSESTTNRRRVSQHATVLGAAFPTNGRRMRAWLKQPDAPMRALSFLQADRHAAGGALRIRRPLTSTA